MAKLTTPYFKKIISFLFCSKLNFKIYSSSKKIIFTLLIIQFTFSVLNAQWIQQYTGTTANLYSIKFINKYTGWTCGAGVILKTTNSGNNWAILNLPVSKQLFKIHPVDSNVIYCVGMFETIIKSTNGGMNWQVIRDGPYMSNTYYCCYFINQNTGWISGGAEQKILKTTNGGVSFDSIVTYTPGFINDIYFRDSLTGLYCDNDGSVRKTTNGGYNWFLINIPIGGYSYDFRNFSFINNQTGWTLTYSGKIFKTTDFGSNWDSIAQILNIGYPLYSIFYSSNNIGYAGGAGNFFYRSTNSGFNWIQYYLPISLGGASSIFFVDDTIGWKVTNAGSICHTTNGGQNTTIINNNEQKVVGFDLYQNYPNPFNSSTQIDFEIIKSDYYKVELLDLLGRKIEELFSGQLKSRKYSISYHSKNLTSGIYIYKLSSEKTYLTKKLIIIK